MSLSRVRPKLKQFVWTFALLLAACVGNKSSDAAKEKERLKQYILNAAPSDIGRKLDIDFDGKVMLLGAKVSPTGTVKPSQELKLTLYWRSIAPVEKGYSLFTHVLDGSGEKILNVDNVGPLRETKDGHSALEPALWEAGKVYVDEQTFTLPKTLKTRRIQLTAGLFKDKDRIKVKRGPHDKENRGIVASLLTSESEASPVSTRVPELRVPKLDKDQKITIDGKLDEQVWRAAARTSSFVDPSTGRPNREIQVRGNARLLWDDNGVYVAIDVRDKDVVGGFKKEDKNPHLWTKDTAEIMIDPEGDGDNADYYEIQINPQNLVFDSQFDKYNEPKTEPDGPFGHEEWSAELKSAVNVDGTMDKSDDRDRGYTVEAFLPWKSFSKAKKIPPTAGDSWRMNFYAMENNGGSSWSAILKQGNFHKASRFGKVTWTDRHADPGRLGAIPAGSGKLPFDRRMLDRARGPRGSLPVPPGAQRPGPIPAPPPQAQ
jgi:hypothetical protein